MTPGTQPAPPIARTVSSLRSGARVPSSHDGLALFPETHLRGPLDPPTRYGPQNYRVSGRLTNQSTELIAYRNRESKFLQRYLSEGEKKMGQSKLIPES